MEHQVTVTVGHLPISIECRSGEFIAMVRGRYGDFARESQAGGTCHAAASDRGVRLAVELIEPANGADGELQVGFESGQWVMRRGDFVARWDPVSGRGWVRQAAYPYAIDSVMRIIHSLVLAESGGFLLHAASAIRNGRAFVFTGVSGAGKTTIARLAPAGATLLTDEISCVRRIGEDYQAFGTPFAGELGIPGADIAAPLAALYFLRKGEANAMAPIEPARAAARALRNVLFFADDSRLGERLFATICDFAARVPAYELTFRPEAAVWDLIL